MTEWEEEPVIRDKRRLDPTTGELRTPEEVAAEEAAAAQAASDGGASSASDPTSGGGSGAEGAPVDQDPVAAA